MKIYALLLSVMITINSIIPYAMLSNSYYFDRYGWAQDLADGLQQFIYDGAGAIRDLIEDADSNPWLDGNNSLVKKEDPVQTPAVNYYNESSNTTSVDMRTYTYNQKTYNTTLNNTYQMVKKDYNTTYDLRTYSYNPVYNDYRSYDYRTYNQYTFYDDDNYYYITENNITNQNYYIINKYDVNDNRYYSYYFEINDTPSWNLTVDDLLGIYFNHNNYYYTRLDDTSDLLGLWHLDGNYNNELNNGISLNYGSSSFVESRYDGGVKTDVQSTPEQNDACMTITGFDEDSYTLEFWFWNMIQNGTYDKLGSTYTWHHLAYVYDKSLGSNDLQRNQSVCVFLDGVEQPRSIYTQQMVSRTPFYYGSTISKYASCLPVYNNVSQVELDNYYPMHSEPELYNNNVYFGFTDNCFAVHTIDDSKTFSFTNPLNGVSGTCKYYLYSLYSSPWCLNVDSNGNIISDGTQFEGKYYRPTMINTGGYTFYPCQVEMKECIMDEVRLSRGALYNGTFSVPLQKFDAGHIWVAPQGTDYNFGDMAYQTNINITDVRIGGAQYTYPQLGNVYIDLNSNGVGSSAAIYDGSVWLPLNYAVWNGYQWQDGKNFNFRNLTFYDVAVSSGNYDDDALREINEKLGLIDEKLGSNNGLLSDILTLLESEFGTSSLEPPIDEDIAGIPWDGFGDNLLPGPGSSPVEIYTISLKDVLIPVVYAVVLLILLIELLGLIVQAGIYTVSLFSVPSTIVGLNRHIVRGIMWARGKIPEVSSYGDYVLDSNSQFVYVDDPNPFYLFRIGEDSGMTLFDFLTIIFSIVFIGFIITSLKHWISNMRMKGE